MRPVCGSGLFQQREMGAIGCRSAVLAHHSFPSDNISTSALLVGYSETFFFDQITRHVMLTMSNAATALPKWDP